MSTIQSEIDRISSGVDEAIRAVADYGVDTTGTNVSSLASKIVAIPKIEIPVSVANGGTGAQTRGAQLLDNIGISTGSGAPPSEGDPGTIYIQFS